MNNDKTFWDKIAPKYATDPIKDMAAYELTLERTLSYLTAEHEVLELGCGTGATALLIAPHVKHITGTDLSSEMINVARTRAAEQDTQNATFETVSVAEAVAEPKTYDAVLGFNLFHLVEGADDCFAKAYARLLQGGLFISKTPCLGDVSLLKRVLFGTMIPLMKLVGKAPSFVKYYTANELESEIEAAGFEIIETLSAPAISRYVVARKR